MHITCPDCSTSYEITLKAFGEAGRTVRCSRCKNVWHATPEQEEALGNQLVHVKAVSALPVAVLPPPRPMITDGAEDDAPLIESPSIVSGLPAILNSQAIALSDVELDWAVPQQGELDDSSSALKAKPRRSITSTGRSRLGLPVLCAALGAIAAGLVIWRLDIVRLLPQTAAFYRTVGLDTNVRGLAFQDVKTASETVDGKAVFVIEGAVVSKDRKAVSLPRLRFSVRDGHGTEIYAWNTVLEQTTVNPGEVVPFRSRLASPPPEGRSIDVRFFSKRDMNAGGA